jgi:protein phosphatase PTC7
MVRPSRTLLKNLASNPLSHATQAPPLVYSLGLSYAAKASPPFVSPEAEVPKTGFQGQNHKLGKWVDEMMLIRAGRGEINEQAVGGWDPSVVDRRIKYGAGEDFFGIVDGGGCVSLAREAANSVDADAYIDSSGTV